MEKIEIIYKILINGLKLNDNTLKVYGISKEDIEVLVARRIIESTENNTYKLVSVEKLRQYGVNLLLKGNYNEANACFRICYELSPNGKNICLQALLLAIKKFDYKKAFEIFANLEKIHPEKNAEDNNLYLYLLSIITKVPEEYSERTRKLESTDLMLAYNVVTKVENEIRRAITHHKFAYACKLINDRMTKEKGYSVKFELMRALVIEAIEWDKRFKSKIMYLAQNEKYEELVSTLIKQQQQRHLSELETNILLIADAIVNISKTESIPTPSIEATDNMQEAIIGNNFELALSINEAFIELTKANKKENTVNILLSKLNSLILEIKEKHLLEMEEKHISETKEKVLTDIEELAYYISSQRMSIEIAIKKLGIFYEQGLLIKLIYARDYYIESNYEMGDKLLQEVEQDHRKTGTVVSLLEEIKANRDNYKEQLDIHTRRLSQK